MDTVFEHDYDFLDGIDKRWLHGLGTDEENNFQKQKHSTFKQNIILSFLYYVASPKTSRPNISKAIAVARGTP